MSAQVFLQDVITENLKAVLTVPVLDQAAQDQSYPYVSISTVASVPLDDSCTRRWEFSVTITVHSKKKGYKEVYTIGDKIDSALAYYSEYSSEYNLIGIVPAGSAVSRDDNLRLNELVFTCYVSRL